ncbi:MAG: hypothetical protein AAF194_08425, partial [Pseudomonadota bacterium]
TRGKARSAFLRFRFSQRGFNLYFFHVLIHDLGAESVGLCRHVKGELVLKRIPLACSRFMNGLMNAAVLLAFFLLTSCSTTIEEAASQSANSKGMYVFTYAKTDTIRIAMEDRLVADLQQQGITAYASHHDLPSFDLIDRQAVLVWSGTTWSFEGDGKGGAISGISTTIADELGRLKRAFPAY